MAKGLRRAWCAPVARSRDGAARPPGLPAAPRARSAGRGVMLLGRPAGFGTSAVEIVEGPAWTHLALATALARELVWESDGTSRIPFAGYTDEALHRVELERFFYRDHWCYVGLEAEIPNVGDFKRSAVGERPVILVRDLEGGGPRRREPLRPPRRGLLPRAPRQRARLRLPLPPVDLQAQGRPAGRAVRRGVQDGKVNGGMPADFELERARPDQAEGGARGGVVFATSTTTSSRSRTSSGPRSLPWFDRLFDGRHAEAPRLQPPAHSGQLEADAGEHQGPVPPGPAAHLVRDLRPVARRPKSRMVMDAQHRHAAMISTPQRGGQGRAVTQRCSSFKADMTLEDPRLLDVVPEAWWDGPTAVMTTLFPSLIIQQQVNSLSTRHILPDGHGEFDFVWTHFGFADDSERDDAAPAAPGQPVRPGGLRLRRRRRGDRAVAAGLRAAARRPHAGRAGRHATSPMPSTWSPRP